MDNTSSDVLTAADNWLTEILAAATADEAQRGTMDQQLRLYDAERELATATMAWREAGRPIVW